MKFSLEPSPPNAIHSYRPGEVKIGTKAYSQSLIVGPERILVDWSPRTAEELQAPHLELMLPMEPEIVILGTGVSLHFPPPEITRCLIEQNIGMEVMDTASACRTYNVLLSEGRRVVAGLLMIQV